MADPALHDSMIDAKAALGAADHRLAVAGTALESRVTFGPSRLLDDETVTRVRGMAGDLAAQLVGNDPALVQAVRDLLVANRAILLHLHALAIEARLIAALADSRGLDAELPPLLRRRLDAGGEAASLATAVLAAQTRLGQAFRRMRLPLGALPGDLQHLAHAIADAAHAHQPTSDALPGRPAHDEAQGRLSLMRRLLAGLGDDLALALRIDEAGAPLFLSALSLASGHPREVVALACGEDDPVRLALLLRATGLDRHEVAVQLLAIRPDADPALAALTDHAHAADAVLGGQGQ